MKKYVINYDNTSGGWGSIVIEAHTSEEAKKEFTTMRPRDIFRRVRRIK